MVARLHAKPGADAVDVIIGDFATTRANGPFRLAYLLRNTIMNLPTQDAQVECFATVAAQLEPGGCFVIEVMVPGLYPFGCPEGAGAMPLAAEPISGYNHDSLRRADATAPVRADGAPQVHRGAGRRGPELTMARP